MWWTKALSFWQMKYTGHVSDKHAFHSLNDWHNTKVAVWMLSRIGLVRRVGNWRLPDALTFNIIVNWWQEIDRELKTKKKLLILFSSLSGLCAACAVHIDEICEEDLEPEEMLLLLEKLGVSQAEGTATPGRSSPEDTGSRSPKSRLRRWSKQNPGPKAYATLLQASNDAGLLWMPQ